MQHYRYERKYLSHDFSPEQLRNFLLISSDNFREIYYKRQVNSIYFDTPEREYFHANINGDQERRKVRVRWYGEQKFLKNLQLEIKTKSGEIMKKDIYPLGEISQPKFSLEEISEVVRTKLSQTYEEAQSLEPVLINSYKRTYFYSPSTKIRITLDEAMKSQRIDHWQRNLKPESFDFCILECKYALADDVALEKIAQNLPLSVTKSSKYVMGMQRSYYAY